jgi:C4-dicarboxylate-specific signal transduction histidine kinase
MNAEQAMTNSKVGDRLLVRIERVDDTILLTVSDNGPGILDENLGKILDPFFTTKEVGEGTRLGLSVCYGIVRDHCGVLRVEKETPHGVRFIVELPVTSQDA